MGTTMPDTLIAEILFGLISAIVGLGSYLGARRASKAQAIATLDDVDAKAFDRARDIYESAIAALEHQVNRLATQVEALEKEIVELRSENVKLLKQVRILEIQLEKP